MPDFFLIFSQASETHLVVKIRGLSAGDLSVDISNVDVPGGASLPGGGG